MAVIRLLAGWRLYLALILAGAGLVGGVLWYGHSRYEAGRADMQAEIELRQAHIERAMQEERDRADAQYRGAVLARQTVERTVSDQRQRIERLRERAQRAEDPSAGRGPDDAGPDWIGVFGACLAEYERVGTDAARLADQVNGLHGYIRGLRPPFQP